MYYSTNNNNQKELSRFFNTLFYDFDGKQESIRVVCSNKANIFDTTMFFRNINDLCKFIDNDRNICGRNTYFNLASTDGLGGKKSNLKRRFFLAFDFDEKDLGKSCNKVEILNRFRRIGVFYNCIVSSGHGYHVYVLIEPTEDIQSVIEVEKAIAVLVGADLKALNSTQLLRVPFTYNVKEAIKKVVLIHLDKEDDTVVINRDDEIKINKIQRRSIDWYKRNFLQCNDRNMVHTKYVLKSTELPECIVDILKNGSKEGSRESDLCDLVTMLRLRKKSLSEVMLIAKEWGIKSNFNDNLEYRVDHIYNNLKWCRKCGKCTSEKDCNSWRKVVYKKDDNDIPIDVPEKHMSKIKVSNRKGGKVMEANDLLVYSVLKFYNERKGDLSRDDLVEVLTCVETQKVALSNKTLSNALSNLEKNGFIKVVVGSDKKKYYRVVDVKASKDFIYSIGINATTNCIRGVISTEELKLYNYMRYLHNKAKRENPEQDKGDSFHVNQELLAKDLGISQSRVAQMIKKLVDTKMLLIHYRAKSKSNGFKYNVYMFTC